MFCGSKFGVFQIKCNKYGTCELMEIFYNCISTKCNDSNQSSNIISAFNKSISTRRLFHSMCININAGPLDVGELNTMFGLNTIARLCMSIRFSFAMKNKKICMSSRHKAVLKTKTYEYTVHNFLSIFTFNISYYLQMVYEVL